MTTSRIQKLAEEATKITIQKTPNGSVPVVHHMYNEVFAKLILQECIDILAGYRGKVVWMNEETAHQHPIYVIQQHFREKQC